MEIVKTMAFLAHHTDESEAGKSEQYAL